MYIKNGLKDWNTAIDFPNSLLNGLKKATYREVRDFIRPSLLNNRVQGFNKIITTRLVEDLRSTFKGFELVAKVNRRRENDFPSRAIPVSPDSRIIADGLHVAGATDLGCFCVLQDGFFFTSNEGYNSESLYLTLSKLPVGKFGSGYVLAVNYTPLIVTAEWTKANIQTDTSHDGRLTAAFYASEKISKIISDVISDFNSSFDERGFSKEDNCNGYVTIYGIEQAPLNLSRDLVTHEILVTGII